MGRKYTGKQHTGIRREKHSNGVVYVFERVTRYSQELKKTITVGTKLLGREDPETGKIVPTRQKGGKKAKAPAASAPATSDPGTSAPATSAPAAPTPAASVSATRQRTGATSILEFVARETNIDKDLEISFGAPVAQKIATIARYLVATGGAPLPRIEGWQLTHPTPYVHGLTEDIYSDLFHDVGIDESGQQKFFNIRANRLSTSACIAYDSTTISTYSSNQHDARQGYNKDRDGLNTIKLLTIYSITDGEPILFSKQPGNIPDVRSLHNSISQIKCFKINEPVFVIDSGFCSQENLTDLARNKMKYLTRISTSVKWVREEIDKAVNELNDCNAISHIDANIRQATHERTHEFSFVRKRTRGNLSAGDTQTFTRKIYVHIFYNISKAGEETIKLNKELTDLIENIKQGEELSEHGQKIADKFLNISHRGRGAKLKISMNNEEFKKASKYFGIFVLVTNKFKDADEALYNYRKREIIEEMYNVHKNHLDGKRPRTWYSDNLKGRWFVYFIAICYYNFLAKKISQLKKSLNTDTENKTKSAIELEKNLKNWLEQRSLCQILDWYDCVETTTVDTPRGQQRWSTESVKRDELLLSLLGIAQR